MLKLNLLPPSEKKELELANLGQLAASLFLWFSVFLVIFVLLLTSAFFYLSILLKGQERLIEIREQDEKTQRLVEIEEKIKLVNHLLNRINLKQENLIIWTPILEELSQITPNGIYLTSFSFQTVNGKIALNGWANNRDNLLGFQESLEQSPYFNEVQAPLTNLLKQTDINFSFTFKPAP